MEVKATVIVWLPDYEYCGGYITQESGKAWMQNCCAGRGASSLTPPQLRIFEIDSQALFPKDVSQSLWVAFIRRWSFATMRAITQHTVFISLKPCQGNWQKKDPAKEPGQKP
jgi:hypothetical protein